MTKQQASFYKHFAYTSSDEDLTRVRDSLLIVQKHFPEYFEQAELLEIIRDEIIIRSNKGSIDNPDSERIIGKEK